MLCVLVGERDWMTVEPRMWADLIDLAARFGWRGTGTVRHPGWGGCYVHACGQMIREADAREFAAALREGVLDVPESEVAPGSWPPALHDRLAGRGRGRVLDVADLLESGPVLLHAGRVPKAG